MSGLSEAQDLVGRIKVELEDAEQAVQDLRDSKPKFRAIADNPGLMVDLTDDNILCFQGQASYGEGYLGIDEVAKLIIFLQEVIA